jgi:hypothetical protein
MGKTKKTGDLVNVVVTDASNNVTLPKALTIGEQPLLTDDSLKAANTAWVNTKLAGKFDNPTGDTTQYIAGDGSLITFPTVGEAGTLIRQVRNITGATLTKGTVVYINGATGNKPTVTKAIATGDSTSAQTFGLIQANIANNAVGYVVCVGDIIGLDTSSFTEGEQLYLSSTVAGTYTSVKQLAPAHLVYIGIITRSHPTLGQIEVKIQNGYELDEIHDVAISSKLNNQFLVYESASDLWKNKSLGTIVGGTSSQFIKGDGSLDSNSYALVSQLHNPVTLGTANGLSLSTQVLSLGLASGAANGALSSTDWTTFNNKQNALTLTVTGNSGAATLVGSTLNIPTYTLAGLGGQTALNGTGFVKVSGTTVSYDNSTYLTTISGITAGGELAGTYPNPTLVNSAVIGKLLSGVNITGGTILATDSILTAFGKLQNQINGLIGSTIYQGTWNANTNTPTLASSVGVKGQYYIVSVAGTTNLNGINDWQLGDWAIYDGAAWQKVDNTDSVVSVNGFTGAVSLTTSNINEGTNLYFTNARAIASALTGYTSGTGTITATDTILQAIQKLNGNIGALTTTNVTEGTRLYFTDARARAAVSAGTGISYNSTSGVISSTITQYTDALARAAISLTVTGNNGASTYSSTTGILNVPTYTLAGLGGQAALSGTGFVKISGTTISYDNSTYYLASNPSGYTTNVGTVTSIGLTSATSGVTIGSSPITTSGNITLAIVTASGTQQGLLSSTDWTTFNNKQNALTNPITGTGTTNYLPKFTGASTLGNSIIFESGNSIGIGTNAPTSYTNYSLLEINNTTGGGLRLKNSAATAQFEVIANSSETYIKNVNNIPLWFGTNNTEALRILANGNVGIGTNTPSSILHIVKGGGAKINFGDSKNTVTIGSVEETYDSAIGFFTQTTTERMRITSSGNVGIGTTSPSYILQTKASSGFVGAAFSSSYASTAIIGTDNNAVWFGQGSNGLGVAYVANNTSGFAQIEVGGSPRFYINSSGNVGIGTTSPSARLSVIAPFGGSTPAAYIEEGEYNQVTLRIKNTNGSASANIFEVANSSTNVFTVSPSGNGVFSGSVTASSFFASSDITLKNIVKTNYNPIGIEAISYKWKDQSKGLGIKVGYSAQQVQEFMPDAVSTDVNGKLSVNYIDVLVAKVAALEARVKQLELN